MSDVIHTLGVPPVINAAGTLTRFGGSVMPPEVVEAMAAASRSFVDMEELHRAAGARIAALVGVEAAHVCACASAGITLMAAACIAGVDPDARRKLPDTRGRAHRFIVHRAQRNAFDQALTLAGGDFLEIDADPAQLAAAASAAGVAGIYYTFAWSCPDGALPLPQVVEIARRANVPVIVDAAAEVPPTVNLARFVREGAALVTFSGGKAIRGPQASGFILGQKQLVDACAFHDGPNMGVGRPMKVGKEEIAGLVRALELYVARDEAAEMALWEARVGYILDALTGLESVRAWRQLPPGIGQQIPHAAVSWDERAPGLTHAEVARRLLAGSPRIALQVVSPPGGRPELRLHPHTLQDGEAEIVAARLREALCGEAQRA